jgi:uncharacterized coiled-coil protein SlyX
VEKRELVKKNEKFLRRIQDLEKVLSDRDLEIEGLFSNVADAEKKVDKLRTKVSELYTELDRLREGGSEMPSTRQREVISEVEIREVPDSALAARLQISEQDLA